MRISFDTYYMCIKHASHALRESAKESAQALSRFIDALFPRKADRPAAFVKNIAQSHEDIFKQISSLNLKRVQSAAYSLALSGTCAALFPYRHAGIKPFIWQIKYHSNPRFVALASDIWSDELIATASASARQLSMLASGKRIMLIHPPSSGHMLGTKKFDQMKLLIDSMIERNSLGNFYEHFSGSIQYAERPGDSAAALTPQHKGTRKERFEWAEQKFRLSDPFVQSLRSGRGVTYIMCIDDIVTTGATFKAIERLILQDAARQSGPAAAKDRIRVEFSAFAH